MPDDATMIDRSPSRPSRSPTGSPALLLGALALASAAALGAPSWAQAASEPATKSPERLEFEAIAKRLFASDNPTLGKGKVEELTARLKQPNLEPLKVQRMSIRLAGDLLRLAKEDEAIAVLERAFERTAGSAIEPELYRMRGLAHLRKAEVENCVRRHNRECCIFPLQEGGVHTISEPARQAREDFIVYLRETTNDKSLGRQRVATCWLLNVACMALAEYPDGVPEAYLIPPATFASDYQLPTMFDVAPALGLNPFDLAGGALVDDLDGDGRLDIVSSTSDPSGEMKAYRNAGDGTFQDVAREWGLDQQLGGLHLLGADYDNDGDLDLMVPRGAWLFDDGQIRKSLLNNDGRGRFKDVTRAAGVEHPIAPTQAAVWGDMDNDGWLDLYVGHESRTEVEQGAKPYPSPFFHSNKDGTFTDIAVQAGVTNDRYTKGVTVGDYDNDGDLDLYTSNIGLNRLYRNEGDLKFKDVAPELKVTEPSRRSFACWFFDYDEDGDLDLWVNAFQGEVADVVLGMLGKPNQADMPCLYQNQGDGTFRDVAKEVGTAKERLPMGSSFGDLDNDGWLDVYLGTGDPNYETITPNVALRNDRGIRFQDVTQAAGLGHLQKGHGVVFVDIDDDGDQDIFHQLGGFFPGDGFADSLFENPTQGQHFVTLELQGVRTNRQGVGARLTVNLETPSGPRSLHRAVGCISSFGAVPRRQEIGLGQATKIASIEIWWPTSGERQKFTDVAMDSWYRIVEGKDEIEKLVPSPVKLAGTRTAEAAPKD